MSLSLRADEDGRNDTKGNEVAETSLASFPPTVLIQSSQGHCGGEVICPSGKKNRIPSALPVCLSFPRIPGGYLPGFVLLGLPGAQVTV